MIFKTILSVIVMIALSGCTSPDIEGREPHDVYFFIVDGVECIYAGQGYKEGGGVTCNWGKYNKLEIKQIKGE